MADVTSKQEAATGIQRAVPGHHLLRWMHLTMLAGTNSYYQPGRAASAYLARRILRHDRPFRLIGRADAVNRQSLMKASPEGLGDCCAELIGESGR